MSKGYHIGSIAKRITSNTCPHCGRSAEGGTSIDPERAKRMPEPGDYAVCIYCASLNVYTNTLALRRIERTERRRLERDPRTAETLKVVLDLVRQYRRGLQ